jgi:Icc-related predicted phosphoesterase
MRIKLLSDLHLEGIGNDPTRFLPNPSNADVLVLAGDITVGKIRLEKVLASFAEHYEHVIFTPGNHEYYKYDIRCLDELKVPSNVYHLNPGKITIDGITLVAATLWTDFRNNPIAEQQASWGINDFGAIGGFKTVHASVLHAQHRDYIAENPADVVITHFLPSDACTHPRFRGSILNYYFANNLDNLILDLQPKYWLFGHTHDSINITIGKTRLISNPYGYHNYEVNKEFQKDLILELA